MGEVTCGGLPHLICKSDHIKMRDYMDGRLTPPKRVTSPTWVPHLHVNRPLLTLEPASFWRENVIAVVSILLQVLARMS